MVINIEVRLFATFREGREKKYFLRLLEGTSILDILKMLNIDEKEVSIMLLNGMDGESDRELSDGDVLSLFPPVGGG
ncbi:MoaD/ThiS family protein [Tissierella sp. MB52-C2]|uniref:MoaD/ThiS family protein n=1 Tax=Tissierella sp. MB52-C2 TaxID=3070999 RepID=UPI00280A8F76|nr:MoaD/ThiS family protein [Tissierella sp. MB52-C2]WMM25058.1 MoaD/ThiS family protein [Tissierella sp. MB52-C2]